MGRIRGGKEIVSAWGLKEVLIIQMKGITISKAPTIKTK
jgi:hypothetical protein